MHRTWYRTRVQPHRTLPLGSPEGSPRGWRALAVALVGGLIAAPGAPAQVRTAPAAPSRVAAVVLDEVTVIDMEHGARLRDQRVVVVGNRIRALGSRRTVPVPPGARLVNARGKYVIPGLWDMHIHPSVFMPPEAIYYQAHAAYDQLIANGITGIRDPGATIPLDTFGVWKREIAAGRRVGPRLIVSGPSIELLRKCMDGRSLPPCPETYFGDSHVYISDPAEAPRLVDSIKAAGADMIKIHTVPFPIWFAVAAEARRVGIPFGGHFDGGTAGIDGLMASDSGARILDHDLWAGVCGYGTDETMSLPRCAAAAARLRRNQTWIVGSIGAPDWPATAGTFTHRAMRYVGPINADDWRLLTAAERRQLPSGADFAALLPDSATRGRGCQQALLVYAANLPILRGTDWPLFGGVGGGVHDNLLDMVLCGVPPLWALQTVTLNPARAFGATDSLGTVAVGKVADLVLLEGDPLDDIWNVSKIAGVLANGRYFDRAALDQLLVEAATEWRKAETILKRKREEHEKQSTAKKTP